MYDIKAKFAKNSPLPCWKTHRQDGYKQKDGKTVPNCVEKKSPVEKATRKVCLPKAKIASMSTAAKNKVINAKITAANSGKTRRSSSSNVTGTSSGGSLRTWASQDWRQVGDPSKKCGEA
tara:strand:+ start:186 stop:545 length:360 start_codon:yes stop_codon:yes gene_type:complete